jgi:DNA-directed RNA polymerase specialized sigma24 family protein
MNVSLVRLTPRQWARIPDRRPEAVELWRDVPAAELVGAFGDLEPAEVQVLVLHFQRGLPVPEIAARTGLPSGTVAARLVRGRRRLRRLLRQRIAVPARASARAAPVF